MRETFHQELRDLRGDTLRMGEYVIEAVRRATTALAEGDTELAKAVIAGDEAIDALYLDIEARGYSLLAQQQPVAKDLRLILAIVRIIQDLERSGDLAKNIGQIVRSDIQMVKLKPVAETIGQLGLMARDLLSTAMRAFTGKNLLLAQTLDAKDNQIDELYKRLIKELFRLEKESSLELAVNMVLTGRYFERIADHAVNIAIWVAYLITGNLPA
ncbi:MAG: phosphate signaling complex protein PhoU [Actinomycetota bacterium]|nr:phosphate signaling complex protein PhoU [Actinomycetota bacterium]